MVFFYSGHQFVVGASSLFHHNVEKLTFMLLFFFLLLMIHSLLREPNMRTLQLSEAITISGLRARFGGSKIRYKSPTKQLCRCPFKSDVSVAVSSRFFVLFQ